MDVLIVLIIVALLTGLLVVWFGFVSALALTSRYELKKKAQSGDATAKTIYGLTAGGREVFVAVLLGAVFIMATIVVLLEAVLPTIVALMAATLIIAIFGVLFPFLYGNKLGLHVTARMAPLAAKLLTLMRPVTRPLVQRIDQVMGKKSFLYSKEQLLKVLDDHTRSPYADISADEVKLVRNSLAFGSKKIQSIMVPRHMVTMVSDNDAFGPLVMDELHKSGHSRFPVYKHDAPDTIVGIIYLRDLIGDKKSGHINTLMDQKVYFVHEELDLNHALDAFIKTKHHLFIVVNNFEEFVGIVTIEDVLEQIIGRQIVDEFDNYENLREVAALRAKKQATTMMHAVPDQKTKPHQTDTEKTE